ncbi:MAG: hypothetical protein ACRENN_11195 [Candidatus Eiseniibacteriota bacterium]
MAIDLEDFVSQTLVQISKGVLAAQREVAEIGGAINPPLYNLQGTGKVSAASNIMADFVDFDVAVSATETKSLEGGAKAHVWVASAGGVGTSTSSNEATSRVRFKVPVVFPIDEGFAGRVGKERNFSG